MQQSSENDHIRVSMRMVIPGNGYFCEKRIRSLVLNLILVEQIMARVKIYSTGTCPICDKTKTLLNKWNIPYEEARIDLDREQLKEMLEITEHARTVPQIAIDGKWIGGFTELTELHMEDKLDDLMSV